MTHKPPQGIAARHYSHMCRDGHEQIGHNDSEHEMCPLCRALAAPPDPRKDLAALDDAIQCAARDLPERWRIEVVVEKSSGWANLYDPKDDCLPDSVTGVSPDFNLEEQVRYLTKWAVGAERRGAKR